MNNKTAFVIVGIVIGVVITLILGSTRAVGPMMWGGNYLNDSLTSGRIANVTNSIDRHFIEQMIPHHDGAIAMAELALKRAINPEIKTLAQAIIKAQTEEIGQMESWYQEWFKQSVPQGSAVMGGMMSRSGMHMGSSQDIDVLRNASDFDKEFIRQMIPHHQMAIMMARMLESGTNRAEMKLLAENIIDSQSEEIIKMQGWFSAWYK